MSDDEGPDDGDFEDIGEGLPDGSELGAPDVPEVEEEGPEGPEEVDGVDDITGLDGMEGIEIEDAAGTDDEDEDEEEAAVNADDEVTDVAASASAKAHPTRARVDPILKMSNKHRIVRIIPPNERKLQEQP